MLDAQSSSAALEENGIGVGVGVGGRVVAVPLPSARSPTLVSSIGGSSVELGLCLPRERTDMRDGIEEFEYECDEDAIASPLLVSHLNSASLAGAAPATRWTSGTGRSQTLKQVIRFSLI